MTLEQRLQLATELRQKGYNCAQTLLMVYHDITGLDNDTAAKIACGLGGGVGGQGEVCGVVTAMSLIKGLSEADSNPANKATVYKETRLLTDKFRDLNDGLLLCRELKRPGMAKPCSELINDGITIIHNYLDNK
jgi:C_GCAxxG_C_C family probable redox protein